MQINQSRRDFLASASSAAAASLLGARASLADEGPPETTTIRLGRIIGHLRRAAVHCRRTAARRGLHRCPLRDRDARPARRRTVARGAIGLRHRTSAWVVLELDAGRPTHGAGGHACGCYELFAHEPIRTISDLKGRRWRTIPALGREHLYSLDHGHAHRPRCQGGHQLGFRPLRHGASLSPARPMPFSVSRPSRRSCAPADSAASSSIPSRTGPGRSTSAA